MGKRKYVPTDEQANQLNAVLSNVKNPYIWANEKDLFKVIAIPSLRGMAYGYVAEYEFARYLRDELGIADHTRDDDHKKTKSDLNFIYQGRTYTTQVKCLQTNSIKINSDGTFAAVAQNDASDKRTVFLGNGESIQTTNYIIGEYDILVSTVQPFTGEWTFVFKKNKDLKRSTHKKYTEEQRKLLLATSEPIAYPDIESTGWTYDLFSLLSDTDLGKTQLLEETEKTATVEITVPESHEKIVVEKEKKKRRKSDNVTIIEEDEPSS